MVIADGQSRALGRPVCTLPAKGTGRATLLPAPTVDTCLPRGLVSAVFSTLLCFLLVILLFPVAAQCNAEVSCGVLSARGRDVSNRGHVWERSSVQNG